MTNFFTGGRASRAEVYGLFFASVVLIGGGVSGAIAFTNTGDPAPVVSETPAAVVSSSPSASPVAAPSASAVSSPSASVEAAPVASPSPAVSASGTTCPYTEGQQKYYGYMRAGKQTLVDEAQQRVSAVQAGIASNTAHVEELLAAPYRPIEVFQWKPDGSPYVWRVDSNEEIAFERQRIADNQAELVRAQAALGVAVAERDLIPGCWN
jgi:hypothetical protein